MLAQRIQSLAECDEVARDQPGPLVNQLVKRVLAVGPRLTPVNRTGLIGYVVPAQRYVFAIALHRQLLEVSWETLQVLLIGQHRDRFRAQEIRIPDREQTHEYGHVSLERSRAEVLVHLVEAFKQGPEV